MSVHIITDSASDITQAEAKAYGIEVLPLHTTFGDTEYLDGVTIDNHRFFQMLVESDTLPTTSQLSPYHYEECFQAAADAGDEVLCVVLSSKLSGCCQSAGIAAEAFGDRVTVVDSENVCIGQRILVEASPRDRIWGIGMGRQNPEAEDPLKWRGKNLLGFALTQARDILREEMQR